MALATTLEIVSLVELSVKYGEVIKTFIHDVRHSDEDQDDMLLDVSGRLKVIKLHDDMLQKLPQSDVEALTDRMKRMKKSAEELVELTKKLRTNQYGALNWATGKKRKLQKTVDTILNDQGSWALELILLGVYSNLPVVDGDTKRIVAFIESSLKNRQTLDPQPNLELPPDRLRMLEWTTVECSNFETAISQNGNHLITETHEWESQRDKESTLGRIREVAMTFHASEVDDCNFQSIKANIAQCLGYVPFAKGARMVFELPGGTREVMSLRQLLTMENTHSLNARLELARSLSTAVFFTHAYQYVHKNIRSANIVLCQGSTRNLHNGIGQVILAGFGDSRAVSKLSSQREDMRHEYDIYRHPSRIGPEPLPKYTFVHDVYSLGVCLLEIGLWTDMLDEDWKELHDAHPRERPGMLKSYAEEFLPVEMGTAYRDIVLDCLGGVEGSFVDAVEQARDGRQVGMGYIKVVLDGLGAIAV
ncbi:hypothetical protein PRZ48_013702 [Zasmidium cellare]|uniref:Protein kinase domain-containing protein n=1 Tax=Zasmidium cellare TaxID=395010 RepID=A0ABR0E2D9_ZASCE|nr:hypothetical protein PRZ48_013702 [Zasmidium cellare]